MGKVKKEFAVWIFFSKIILKKKFKWSQQKQSFVTFLNAQDFNTKFTSNQLSTKFALKKATSSYTSISIRLRYDLEDVGSHKVSFKAEGTSL